MSSRAVLLLVLGGTSAGAIGCKDKLADSGPAPLADPGPATVDPVSAGATAPGSDQAPGRSAGLDGGTGPAAAAGLVLALPAETGPPAPFDKLRRHQKWNDVLATLGPTVREATEREIAQLQDLRTYDPAWTRGTGTVYATPVAGVFARLSFAQNRLDGIVLIATDRAALETAVTNRWGGGRVPEPGVREYPASPAGWSATLTVLSRVAELALTVSELAVVEHTPDAPGLFKMFADVGTLIGEPLTEGQRVFGEAFVIESADDDGAVAEATEARQGYADVTLPWTGSKWTTVLRVDQQTGKVVQATIDGETDEYEERVELMKQLKAAFGKPQAVITDAGYQRIGFSTQTLVITLTDDDPHWTIEMHRR